MLDRSVTQAGAAQEGCADMPSRTTFLRLQAAVVDDLGDELANSGMHPPGALKEDSAFGRNGLVGAEEMFQNGEAAVVGMDALRDLRELQRVAEEDDVLRGG